MGSLTHELDFLAKVGLGVWDESEASELVALASLGLWYQDRMGGSERTGSTSGAKTKRQTEKSPIDKKG